MSGQLHTAGILVCKAMLNLPQRQRSYLQSDHACIICIINVIKQAM